jgi:hypothetical protein
MPKSDSQERPRLLSLLIFAVVIGLRLFNVAILASHE